MFNGHQRASTTAQRRANIVNKDRTGGRNIIWANNRNTILVNNRKTNDGNAENTCTPHDKSPHGGGRRLPHSMWPNIMDRLGPNINVFKWPCKNINTSSLKRRSNFRNPCFQPTRLRKSTITMFAKSPCKELHLVVHVPRGCHNLDMPLGSS